MNNRLKDLKRNHVVRPEEVDVEAGNPPDPAEANKGLFGDNATKDFWNEVRIIKEQITKIHDNVRNIEAAHSKSLTIIDPDKRQEHSVVLDELMQDTKGVCTVVKKSLKNMEVTNKKYQEATCKEGELSSEVRVRQNMYQTLNLKFTAALKEYHGVQEKYEQKYKETVKRQFKIAKPDASPEEMEKVMSGEVDIDQIYMSEILQTPAMETAKNALRDVQERHRDILRLETSLTELLQLFQDMAVLVEAQGEMLDDIEYNVQQSVNYTERGVEELVKSRQLQKNYRKYVIILIVILIIILVILLFSSGIGATIIGSVVGTQN